MKPNTKTQRSVVSDERIIELYWERDERAIELTAEKYGTFLFRIAYNLLHDRSDCEECQNDTYLGIWNAIPPYRPEVFSSFIAKIMRNLARRRYKERTRQKHIPSEMTVSIDDLEKLLHGGDAPDTAYEEKASAEELGKMINEYLGTLTARRRFIFIGRFYMGDTLETIAAELGVNASTVHREIDKIKQGLKSHLERNDVYV